MFQKRPKRQAQIGGDRPYKSLFWNILPLTHLDAIFCRRKCGRDRV